MQGKLLEQDDLQPVGFDWSKLRQVKRKEVALRFGFGAVIALIAAVVGATAGPKVGGLFLAFPAILPASLTLIEKKEGLTRAWSDASGGLLGAFGLAAFAATVVALVAWNPAIALIAALSAWVVVSTGLYFFMRVTGLFLKTDRAISKWGAPGEPAH